jgi:asparagine synthase (glutamine-hydrolysing)
MCGICGIVDLKKKKRVDKQALKKMIKVMHHRGPDGTNHFFNGNIGFGFTRLSIIDLDGGMQPIFNEDQSMVMICNGEIFNYVELREQLIQKGHTFRTRTDVEVIVHLYEERGLDFLNQLNGQFAFAIFDFKKQQLFCSRGHFGVIPFFYTIVDGLFIFGSEIKALLQYPGVKREVDLVGLDQVFTFPGLICPRTMFKNIHSLENGNYIHIKAEDQIHVKKYWDVVYPKEGELEYKSEQYYVEKLNELFTQSVKLRLRSDVPVGIYISGGLDSSIISAKTKELTPNMRRYTFSVDFEEKEKSESKYQRMMAQHIDSHHTEKYFIYSDISERLQKAIYHSEYPLKETYDTASLALSEAAREKNIKVVLTGEGSDEWFAGYPGYKFDKFRILKSQQGIPTLTPADKLRIRIWGDEKMEFETDLFAFQKVKEELYSNHLNQIFHKFDSLQHKIVDKELLNGRDMIHKRSYLDYKLRLVGHLISDHGDRMAYAHSVEARYPFLDKDLVEFACTIPPNLKLKDFDEKYILKQIARGSVPQEILKREKFAFHAPGSHYLLKRNIEYINDLLSYETIKRQGFFNPDTIESLKKRYSQDGFELNIPYESDLLIIVITFGIFLEQFQMS